MDVITKDVRALAKKELASTEQTFRSRRQCFLRKKRGFWYGMATVPRLSGFVEVTEW